MTLEVEVQPPKWLYADTVRACMRSCICKKTIAQAKSHRLRIQTMSYLRTRAPAVYVVHVDTDCFQCSRMHVQENICTRKISAGYERDAEW